MSCAAHGLRAWALQRVSALYLLGFSLYLVFHFLFHAPTGFQEWRSWVGAPGVSISVVLFFIMLLIHAWVGARDVIMDYIHPPALRVLLLALLGFGVLTSAIWAAWILVSVVAA